MLLRVATSVIDMRSHVNKVQALVIAASYQRLRVSRRRHQNLELLLSMFISLCVSRCNALPCAAYLTPPSLQLFTHVAGCL